MEDLNKKSNDVLALIRAQVALDEMAKTVGVNDLAQPFVIRTDVEWSLDDDIYLEWTEVEGKYTAGYEDHAAIVREVGHFTFIESDEYGVPYCTYIFNNALRIENENS